jgi:aminopeptidase N
MVDFVVEIGFKVCNPVAGVVFLPDAVYTQGLPCYARYWFPCFNQLNLRTEFEIFQIILHDTRWKAYATGGLREIQESPDGKLAFIYRIDREINPDNLAFVLLKDYSFIRTVFNGHFTDLQFLAFSKKRYVSKMKYTFYESNFLKGLRCLT